MAFDRAGTLPTECSCGRKAKETIVIFGIADHHQRFTFVRARFVHQFLHQFLAHAALLDCWQDSNGPYHDERMLPSCDIHQGDWPALQNHTAIVLTVHCGETLDWKRVVEGKGG